ncbi:transposase, IS605 OrfB family [Methanohalobium evestigatum Z-7303]|uniref:Transposase, IS605 OrfB family n=2 Tax=Methanohalobium evestigatum TaxID=2322 RepID=D7E9A6_METEZ|nr:transposase, IS605 OrfB family [Methanohalobium evestigatum Z-7303]
MTYFVNSMYLTLKVKLNPDREQRDRLLTTMQKFNEACNYASEAAWHNKKFGKTGIQKLTYYDIRQRFGLSAQLTVRAIGKVAESYSSDRKTIHKFDRRGAVVYDQRVLSFKGNDTVSILTVDGREKIGISYGDFRLFDISKIRGQTDLIYEDNNFYLMLVMEVGENEVKCYEDVMGVDLGVVNIATTSDNEVYKGSKADEIRERYTSLKSRLQSKGTWSAKKHLKKLSKKERRFKRDLNHRVAKQLVKRAKDTSRAIALENLNGFRPEATVTKAQRDRLGKWAFSELTDFILYKAKLEGVPVVIINPMYTSQQCSECGYIDKNNRQKQANFKCKRCGHRENADYNASKNIAHRGAVSLPNVLRLASIS